MAGISGTKLGIEPMDEIIGCLVTIINEELSRGHSEDGLSPLMSLLGRAHPRNTC